ncbi:MAG: YXWGXW repeat-containing protein [Candidatus Acidiferrum sp.]
MIRLTKIAALLVFVVLAALAMAPSTPAQIAVGVSIRVGPPALPVYAQPICPAAGYIWTPGFWAYGPYGYYWVPGTWVLAPAPGLLWTPGYWGWGGGVYAWHAGYWGPHVGFYGGINYGFGYGGVGFVGGQWRGGVFHYNTAVTNVNTTIIHNTYVNNVMVNKTVVNNVSYNGGEGGIQARPTPAEQAAMHERHGEATALQTQHEQMARNDHSLLASVNHGQPAIAATARPAVFKGEGVVGARGAAVNGNHPGANTNAQMDRPPSARSHITSNGNANHPTNTNVHSEDRPNTSSQPNHNTNQPNHNSNQPNPNRPNNTPSNTHTNNDRPNTSKAPQQHESRPEQHEPSHHEGPGR